jgi:hypothetical protein
MGMAIYVQGYHKEPSCISGEIKTIGWYEVSGKIYKHRIPDSDRVLHRSHFDVVILVKNAWWDYGFQSEAEFLWFYGFVDNMSGWGLRSEGEDTLTIALDAKRFLVFVEKIIAAFDKVSSGLEQPEREWKDLLVLKDALELTSSQDGLIGITIG